MKYDYIIIGGGASGLMLAANLELNNRTGLILEKSNQPGAKLLVSGGGHCNITHAGSIKDFPECYGDSGRRIRSALYKHSNLELIHFLEANGVKTTIQDDGRVFPESMKARDILDLLLHQAKINGWELHTETEVSLINKIENYDNGEILYQVGLANGATYQASKIVIATGGLLHTALRPFDLEITPLKPSLAPIKVKDYPYADISGISIMNSKVTIGEGKKAPTYTGSLLFTHKDFSGPAILNLSRYACPGSKITINYLPDCSDSEDAYNNMENLPRRLQRLLIERATNSEGNLKLSLLKKLLVSDEFEILGTGAGPMVTKGGVALSEIECKTMEAKNYPGLFVIGEALDIDGMTGGYNLQFGYSSAMAVVDGLR